MGDPEPELTVDPEVQEPQPQPADDAGTRPEATMYEAAGAPEPETQETEAAGAPEPETQETEAVVNWTHQIGKYRFNAGAPLGDGTFARVYPAVDSETGDSVALKIALDQRDEITWAQLNEIMCQEACHAHEFVVSVKDVVYTHVSPALPGTSNKKQLAVVMEKMGGGELFAEAVKAGGLDEEVAKRYFRQILLAMAHVHARGVAHRDMKLDNLLLNNDKTVCKVCGFGLAKYAKQAHATSIVGKGRYIAPEVIATTITETRDYNAKKADMWSCGVILYCMVECRFPFEDAGPVMHGSFPERSQMVERLMVSH